MDLNQFESFVSDTILARGYDYYKRRCISNIVEIDNGHVQATVMGTDDYVVNVSMDGQTVLRTVCTCPFDLAQFCKHQVAVFYALREGNQEERESLPQLLNTLEKETLIKIILQNVEEHPELERTLSLKYGSGDHETKDAQLLIQNYFEEASIRGFINWRNMNYAMRGAHLVLEQASSLLDGDDPQRTIALSLTVLAESVDIIDHCDDSGGDVGIVIDEALELVDDAVNHPIIQQNQSIQEEVFHELILEATQPRYYDWDEEGIALLGICARISGEPHLRKQLIDRLDAWLKNLGGSWDHSYTSEKLLLIKLDLIEQYDPAQYVVFLKEHLYHS